MECLSDFVTKTACVEHFLGLTIAEGVISLDSIVRPRLPNAVVGRYDGLEISPD